MSDQRSRFDGICQIATLASDNSYNVCDECNKTLQGDYSDAVNHYLDHDNWRLLHVGSETTGEGSNLRNRTIATVGRLEPID